MLVCHSSTLLDVSFGWAEMAFPAVVVAATVQDVGRARVLCNLGESVVDTTVVGFSAFIQW